MRRNAKGTNPASKPGRKSRALSRADRLESTALRLPLQERARLAERLILSLDTPSDEENLRLWVAEAERRLKDLRRGAAKEVPVHPAEASVPPAGGAPGG